MRKQQYEARLMHKGLVVCMHNLAMPSSYGHVTRLHGGR